MIDKILKFRNGMHVQRYHTVRLLNAETVGHHSANVAWLITQLTQAPSVALMQAALLHDAAEQWTGDIPATAKWMSIPLKNELDTMERVWHKQYDLEMPELTEHEAKILKEADTLDLCFKMAEEYHSGNKYILPVFNNGIVYLQKGSPTAVTRGLIKQLQECINEQG